VSTLTRPFPKDLLERALGVAREIAAPQGVGLRLFADNSGTIYEYNVNKDTIFSWDRPAELERAVTQKEREIEARKNPLRLYWKQDSEEPLRWVFQPPVVGVRARIWRSGLRFHAMVNGAVIKDTYTDTEAAMKAVESILSYGANYIIRIQKGEFLDE